MTAKELKASILDLAVRGKLVPQDPNDEPASVLLEKIRAEKQKLVKAGKIKKEKNPSEIYIASDGRPYEKFADGSEICIEDEIPFDLPPGWAWARLGNLAETITSGSREWAKYYSETGDLFLRMGNLSRDSFDLRLGSVQHVRPPDNSEGARTCLQPFDLLFSITAEIGLLGLIPEKFGRAFINQHTAMIRFTRIVRGLFLPYVLLAPHMQRVYHAGKHGLKSSFRLDTISSFIIPLPPLSEQHRIIAKIEELMSKVGEYAKAAQQLTEFETRFPADLKRAILQSAVEGKLVPHDPNDDPASILVERIAEERKALVKVGKLKRDKHESVIFRSSDRLTYETRDGETVCIEDELPFKIPESWAWVRLGAISNYGQCTGTDNAPKGSWMLDLEDIERGGRLLVKNRVRESKSTKHVFMKGQVLYSKLRTYLQKVLVADEDGYCTSEIIPITFFGTINPHFATLVLNSPYFVDYTQECCCGVKMPRLTTEDARAAYFPLPPLAEQQRIVAEVERMEAQVAQLQ